MSQSKETYKVLSTKEKHALIKAIETSHMAKLSSYTTQQLLGFKDWQANNLIHIAMQRPNHKMLMHLVSISTQYEPLFAHTFSSQFFQFYQAVLLDNQILVKEMLQKDAHYLDLTDAFGFAPVHYATMLGLTEMTELLNGHKKIKKDLKGCNNLHLAVQFGHKDLASKFLKSPEFYSQDNQGNTPLHYAVMYNQIDMAKIILQQLSTTALLVKNAELQSSLHLAIHQGNDEAIQLIIHQYHQKCENHHKKYDYYHEKTLIQDIYYAYYQSITKNSSCRIVDVSKLKLSDDEFLILLPKIMQLTSFKTLNISHNNLTRKSIKQLSYYLTKCEVETFIADCNDLSIGY